MTASRRAGILLHPTSLPGPFGIGDLGPGVDLFLDWLEKAGQSVWQVLPLGPPALHGVPYTGLSAFAGNPALLSLELLVDEGYLSKGDLATGDLAAGDLAVGAAARSGTFAEGEYALGRAESWKNERLRTAWQRFGSGPSGRPDDARNQAFRAFCRAPAQQCWLDDWALFATLKEAMGGREWTAWDAPYARRDEATLRQLRDERAEELDYHRWLQFLFDRQWHRVRVEAARRGIELMGDMPIYVAQDSADVWAHRHLFDLDEEGRPRHVAGVPPDYFSETGQRWGNPIYRWDRMADEGYRWWVERMRANLRQADLVRLDHFRAFAGYWSVPAEEETAENGRWEKGPGQPLFDALSAALGPLPLVAEDLGEITDDVHELRRELALPGMRVLQFGFGPEADVHTPHRLEPNMVVYTGTHDNDTALGWYRSLEIEDRDRFHRYTGSGPREVHWTLVRTALASVADLALVPAQDVLGLDTSARMNIPGVAEGNWLWRLRGTSAETFQLTAEHARRLRRLVELFERLPSAGEEEGEAPEEPEAPEAPRTTDTSQAADPPRPAELSEVPDLAAKPDDAPRSR